MMVNDGYISGWWLSPIPLNNMSSSVGMMMPFPICGKKTFMFQTTNQVYSLVIKNMAMDNPSYT
jgi:hypothetical protein